MTKVTFTFTEQKRIIAKFIREHAHILYIGNNISMNSRIGNVYIMRIEQAGNFDELTHLLEKVYYCGFNLERYHMFKGNTDCKHPSVCLVMPKQLAGKMSNEEFKHFIGSRHFEDVNIEDFISVAFTAARWSNFVTMFNDWIRVVYVIHKTAYFDIARIAANFVKIMDSYDLYDKKNNSIGKVMNAFENYKTVIEHVISELTAAERRGANKVADSQENKK